MRIKSNQSNQIYLHANIMQELTSNVLCYFRTRAIINKVDQTNHVLLVYKQTQANCFIVLQHKEFSDKFHLFIPLNKKLSFL